MTKYAIDIPERLTPKAVILSPKGSVADVVVTVNKTQHGERLYRLRYHVLIGGHHYLIPSDHRYIENDHKGRPHIVGFGWTRDQLVEMGCKYIPREDVSKSRIISRLGKIRRCSNEY
jgi:hypothetical protein